MPMKSLSFGEGFVILLHLLASSYALQAHVNASESPALTSGYKSEGELGFNVVVPEGTGPFPVVVLLHSACYEDGSCENTVTKMLSCFSYLHRVVGTHIVVAPIASDNTWNVHAEESKRDDVTLVGTNLLAYLTGFSNVQPTFKLVGFSNGAGLVHRILIENDNAQIIAAVACATQLSQKMWHDGNFYIGGNDNAYVTPKQNLQKRHVLQLTGDNDVIVPAYGGPASEMVPGDISFLPWGESAYHYAQAFGYTGAQAGDLDATYLNRQVQAHNIVGASHSMPDFFSNNAIEPFLLDPQGAWELFDPDAQFPWSRAQWEPGNLIQMRNGQ